MNSRFYKTLSIIVIVLAVLSLANMTPAIGQTSEYLISDSNGRCQTDYYLRLAVSTPTSQITKIKITCAAPIQITAPITVIQYKEIDGSQANNTKKCVTLSGGGTTSIFRLDGPGTTLKLTGMQLQNGRAQDVNYGISNGSGGAIYMQGGATLELTNTYFNDNTTVDVGDPSTSMGGAIYNRGGKISIFGGEFSNNISLGYGGAIALQKPANSNIPVSLTISTYKGRATRFANNIVNPVLYSAVVNAGGGAIYGENANLDIGFATFDTNKVFGVNGDLTARKPIGGALYLKAGATKISGSTFASNLVRGITTTVPSLGGAIAVENTSEQDTVIVNSSFYRNSVTLGSGAAINALLGKATVINTSFSENGGTDEFSGATTTLYAGNDLYISNSIISAKNGTKNCGDNRAIIQPRAIVDDGNNIEWPQNSGNVCQNMKHEDPLYQTLDGANYGGPTFSLKTKGNSPAINGANLVKCTGVQVFNIDQRGAFRVINGSEGCDIGAVEYDSVPRKTVTNLIDRDSGQCNDTDCTLREAVTYAYPGSVISFAVTGDINLTLGRIPVTKGLTIQGRISTVKSGLNPVTIRGGGTTALFSVDTTEQVTFNNLNFYDGFTYSENGGAIVASVGDVRIAINRSEFKNNRATQGGAISIPTSGTLVINSSLFWENNSTGPTGSGAGGALWLRQTATTITASTFVRNTTMDSGGAIASAESAVTLRNDLFVDNFTYNPDVYRGHTFGSVASYTIINTAMINKASYPFTSDVSRHCEQRGAAASSSNNLAYPTGGYSCVSTIAQNTNPTFDPAIARDGTGYALLTDNGGPTRTIRITSNINNPLIDTGTNTDCPMTDQRGLPRRGTCDIGATEYQPVYKETVGLFNRGIFRLYASNTTNSAYIQAVFGNGDGALYADQLPVDYPVVGDWDGDQIDTIGIYRRSEGKFYLSNSNTAPAADPNRVFLFGNPGDLPLAGRWDGTMTADGIGVYRRSGVAFYTARNANTTPNTVVYYAVFGNPDDLPLAGDWDNDGYDGIGVFRPSENRFYLTNTNENLIYSDYAFTLNGATGGRPVVGRWVSTTDGTRPGYWLQSPGTFNLRYSLTDGSADASFSVASPPITGTEKAIPLAGRWTATAPDNAPRPPNVLVIGPTGRATPAFTDETSKGMD
jgi:hypothetical protein